MAVIQFLVPNATDTDGGWFQFPASGNKHDKVNDLDDNTYIYRFAGDASDATGMIFGMGTYVLATNERCRAARTVVRRSTQVGTGISQAGIGVSGTFVDNQVIPNDGSFGNWSYGSWVTDPPGAATEWLQATIDALQIRNKWVTGTGNHLIIEDRIEIEIITQAQTAVSSPTPDQITATTPTVVWTYTGNGEAQKKYRVKIFTKAVAEGGGFNPETSANVWDSGEVSSSATSALVTTALTPGSEYYTYVKTAKDFNATDWWGTWSSGVRFKVDSTPVATVTAPPASVTTTTRPPIVWTYADADGHPQESYEARVYLRPGGTWVGFDPDVATPYWASGEVFSAVLTATPTVDMTNLAVYRAYVRLRENSGALTHLRSAWAFTEFTMNLTPPPVPLLSATTDLVNARTVLTLTHQASAVIPEYYTIYRSADGVTNWEIVRGASAIAHVSHGTVSTIYDYETPFNVVTYYRAIATDTTTGVNVASAPTANVSVTLAIKKVWLKDATIVANNISIPVENTTLSITRRRVRVIKEALGRLKPIVIRGTATHESFGCTFTIQGQAQFNALMVFLMADKTFLYQSPKRNFWVEVSGDVTIEEYLWDDLHGEVDTWKVTVPLQEVEPV